MPQFYHPDKNAARRAVSRWREAGARGRMRGYAPPSRDLPKGDFSMHTTRLTSVLLMLAVFAVADCQFVSGQERVPTGPNKQPLRKVIRDMNRLQPVEVHKLDPGPADGAIVFPQYSNPGRQDQIESRYLELSRKRLQMLKLRGDEAVENAMAEIESELREADQQSAEQKLNKATELLEAVVKEHPKSKAASAAKRMLKHRSPAPLQ